MRNTQSTFRQAALTALSFLAVLADHARARTALFSPRRDFPVGGDSRAVVVGDFNRDGMTGVATAELSSNNISVLLGNGDGTLRPALPLAVSLPRALIVGDFNGDGVPDLAAGGGQGVSLFLGNGDGTFQPARDFAVGGQPALALAAGDFNRDGALDLVVLNNDGDGGSVISLHLGNGDGTFQPARRLATGKDFRGLASSDFDGDGKLDLAVTNVLSTMSTEVFALWVLRGNGDGTVQAPLSFEATGVPGPAAVGDFTGEGSPDLVVAN